MSAHHRPSHPAALRFACVGLANTALCGALIVLARQGLGWPDLLSNGTGYAVGLGVAYVAHSRWTFAAPDTTRDSTLMRWHRYLVVMASAWALNAMAVQGLLTWGIQPLWAHACGMPLYTVSQFIGLRFWAMKPAPMAHPVNLARDESEPRPHA